MTDENEEISDEAVQSIIDKENAQAKEELNRQRLQYWQGRVVTLNLQIEALDKELESRDQKIIELQNKLDEAGVSKIVEEKSSTPTKQATAKQTTAKKATQKKKL